MFDLLSSADLLVDFGKSLYMERMSETLVQLLLLAGWDVDF